MGQGRERCTKAGIGKSAEDGLDVSFTEVEAYQLELSVIIEPSTRRLSIASLPDALEARWRVRNLSLETTQTFHARFDPEYDHLFLA